MSQNELRVSRGAPSICLSIYLLVKVKSLSAVEVTLDASLWSLDELLAVDNNVSHLLV